MLLRQFFSCDMVWIRGSWSRDKLTSTFNATCPRYNMKRTNIRFAYTSLCNVPATCALCVDTKELVPASRPRPRNMYPQHVPKCLPTLKWVSSGISLVRPLRTKGDLSRCSITSWNRDFFPLGSFDGFTFSIFWNSHKQLNNHRFLRVLLIALWTAVFYPHEFLLLWNKISFRAGSRVSVCINVDSLGSVLFVNFIPLPFHFSRIRSRLIYQKPWLRLKTAIRLYRKRLQSSCKGEDRLLLFIFLGRWADSGKISVLCHKRFFRTRHEMATATTSVRPVKKQRQKKLLSRVSPGRPAPWLV